MDRFARSATNIIAAVTALAWLAAVLLGQSQQAAFSLGFIPARLSGADVPWAAVPAFLTPLTATLVHGNLLHLAFNMLMLMWCGAAVERVLGRTGLIGRQVGEEVEVSTPSGDRYYEIKKIEFI